MVTVFIGAGSNLGDRIDYINQAIDNLKDAPEILVERVSSIIETEPDAAPGQKKYLNAVLKIKTNLGARELLQQLQVIEGHLGRKRPFKNAPRTIDLDILLYGEEEIDEPDLKVPHPRMLERAFVIGPLLEIEPKLIKTIEGLQSKYDCR
ncbi:MAG: 2-amino-4-hydroxy-6-hydroxymethyldihydropteridine diphosphokinase [Candidatus Omnitrophota bacterium]